MTAFGWTPIRYRNVISLLKNPFYPGAYADGKSVNRTEIVDGRARKTYGYHRPLQDCENLLKDRKHPVPALSTDVRDASMSGEGHRIVSRQ
jgi:hypothetical protein